MAGNNGSPDPPLVRTTSRHHTPQNKLTRHVSFSEDHIKPQRRQNHITDTEAQESEREEEERQCNSQCNMWCAWASLIIGSIIVVGLIIGVVFFSLITSNLPEFHFESLDIRKIDISTTSSDTLLTADVQILLNSTNKNDKIVLLYSQMNVDVSSEGVNLGSMKLPGFSQQPHTSTGLRIRTGVNKAEVDEWDGKDLKANYKEKMMVITVVLKGTVNLLVNGRKVNGYPFTVVCQDIEQTEIDNGRAPECFVKMTPFSS